MKLGVTMLGAWALACFGSAQTAFRVYDSSPANAATVARAGGAISSPSPFTKLLADDVTPIAGYAGQSVRAIGFAFNNPLTYNVTFRAGIRLWDANGANSPISGLPGVGSYLNIGIDKGYLSYPISLDSRTLMGTELEIPSGDLTLPSGRFWVGAQFDNGANASLYNDLTDLNQMGLALGNPITGASGSGRFVSDSGYNCFGVDAPSGAYVASDLALWIGVAGQDFHGEIALQDVVSELAVPRTMTVRALSGATVLAEVEVPMVQAATTQEFSITLPAVLPTGATNSIRFEVDGSSFLLKSALGSVPVPASAAPESINLGSFNLFNGDVDGSGEVDAADIDEVIAAFGDVSAADTDVDGSGEVDAADIDIVIANFGQVDE